MPELEIMDRNNKAAGKVKLPDEVFGVSVSTGILHSAVANYLANQRQGTHATKSKGMVSGGGKKPWKQKHTGRARAGSNRSPIWRKGGTVFGPQPRDYSYSPPKEAKRFALRTALSAKLHDNEIVLIEDLNLEKPRTKEISAIIKNLGFEGKSLLIVVPEDNKSVKLSVRNMPGVHVSRASDLNAYNIIAHDMILITKGAIEGVKEASV